MSHPAYTSLAASPYVVISHEGRRNVGSSRIIMSIPHLTINVQGVFINNMGCTRKVVKNSFDSSVENWHIHVFPARKQF